MREEEREVIAYDSANDIIEHASRYHIHWLERERQRLEAKCRRYRRAVFVLAALLGTSWWFLLYSALYPGL